MKLLDLLDHHAKNGYDDEVCEKTSCGITGAPRFLYDIFFNKSERRERIIRWASSDIIIEVLPYISDQDLKGEMYESLRDKTFKGRTNSSIIKEIGGLSDFAGRIIKYIKITKEMKRELKK